MTTTTNKNFLSPLGFRFQLDRTPNVNYFVQNVPVPSLVLGEFDSENPFVTLPQAGTKLRYEPLSISFAVDENLENYLEIYNWMTDIGFPESYGQYSTLSRTFKRNAFTEPGGVFSDGTLHVLTSNHNGNVIIKFQEMFPISLSELTFDSTLTDVDYLKANVTFRYKLYTIEKL